LAQYKVAIDAGHGGSDNGAVFGNRKEKDDTLRLANAVGKELEKRGVDVYYIRTTDEYETPFKKATDANNSGADYFLSIHRNSSPITDQYSGVQSLIYDKSGIKVKMAENINSELEKVGFKNLGINERPNLVVLKRTKMPSVLAEVGFINNKNDNALFDSKFDEITKAIADGVMNTISPKSQTTIYMGEEENGNQDRQDDNRSDMNGRYMNDGDMNGGDMNGRNMYGGDMNGRNMYGGDMNGRNMYGGDMNGRNTNGRNMYGGDMNGRNMNGGDMNGGDMNGPDMNGGDMNGPDMNGGDMNGPDMNGRNMNGGDMNGPDTNGPDMNGRDMDRRDNKPWKFNENNDGDLGEKLYRVQVGAYRNKESADRMLNALLIEGFPAFIVYDEGIYKVQVGAFRFLANAIKMEERLRRFRYNTYITV